MDSLLPLVDEPPVSLSSNLRQPLRATSLVYIDPSVLPNSSGMTTQQRYLSGTTKKLIEGSPNVIREALATPGSDAGKSSLNIVEDLVRIKKTEQYTDLYHIWPHLHRRPEFKKEMSNNRRSASTTASSSVNSSPIPRTDSSRANSDDPVYSQPFTTHSRTNNGNDNDERSITWPTQFKFIKLVPKNNNLDPIHSLPHNNKKVGNNKEMWASLSSAYAQLLIILVLSFYFQYLFQDNEEKSFNEIKVQRHGIINGYLTAGGCCLIASFYISLGMQKLSNIRRPFHKSSKENSSYIRAVIIIFGLIYILGNAVELSTSITYFLSCNIINEEYDVINWIQPVLQICFTIFQVHFFYINISKLRTSDDGFIAQLCYAHLVAANILGCVRILLWEPQFGSHSVQFCSSSWWTKILSYTFPYMTEYRLKLELHFCLIATAIAYVLWNKCNAYKEHYYDPDVNTEKDDKAESKLGIIYENCRGTSRGLFLGLTVFSAALILIAAFHSIQTSDFGMENLHPELIWLFLGTRIIIAVLIICATVLGLVQLPNNGKPIDNPSPSNRISRLNSLAINITSSAAFIHSIFGMIGSWKSSVNGEEGVLMFICYSLLILQVALQGTFLREAERRHLQYRSTREIGRQILTFLMLANGSLWLIDMLVSSSHKDWWNLLAQPNNLSGRDQYALMLSRIAMPFVIIHRFQSTLVILGLWRRDRKNNKRSRAR